MMTYPLIGNYGLTDEDYETRVPRIGGFIVREYNDKPSNYRYTRTLADVMRENNIPGIEGVDTRAITRMLRDEGSMRAILTERPREEALETLRATAVPHDQVARVSGKSVWFSRTANYRYNVVAVDCGIKLNIVRRLNKKGCNIIVVPYDTPAETILGFKPDALFLSNGPGDPEDVTPVIELVRRLCGQLPIFGICLGHQMIALAFGAKTYKMKFGHRGGNHPVKELATGKVEITSQNHSVRGGSGQPRGHRAARHAHQFARSDRRGPRLPGKARLQRAVPSGERARPAGQRLSFRPLHRHHGGGTQACLSARTFRKSWSSVPAPSSSARRRNSIIRARRPAWRSRNRGTTVILLNSNPATIMTDTHIADKVYMEPLTLEYTAKIIRKERPDALLPTLGGQTGLNLAMQLHKKGVLKECQCEILGTGFDCIEKAEDREKFKELCLEIGEPVIASDVAGTVEEALAIARRIGFPVVLRPAFTLGGTGGGFADDEEELLLRAENALQPFAGQSGAGGEIHPAVIKKSNMK